MKKSFVFLLVLHVSLAGWGWWPFAKSEKTEPRLSELMEPASLLIDEASDLASDGNVAAAVEKYRAALDELDRVERENPERADKPEFATLKTKRAYVTAAIDSMLFSQARDNAKAVAVSDTTELEKKLAAEKAGKQNGDGKPANAARDERGAGAAGDEAVRRPTPAKKTPRRKPTKKESAMNAIASGDYETAAGLIEEMLAEKPNGAAALNLRSAMETAQGRYRDAEATLDQAIVSNPRDYHAYYNMAMLYLKTQPDNKSGARRYYETGRTFGGPKDEELEELLK